MPPMTQRSPAECAIRQAHIRFGLVFWGGAFLASTVLYVLKITDFTEVARHATYLAEKFLRYGSGWLVASAISYALFRLHQWAQRRGPAESSLPVFIVFAFIISLAAAPVWAAWGYATQAAYQWSNFINDTALGAALFFGWSCLFISLLFSFELNDRERRLAAAREEALSAQMRALRYQINPHFLFNTLNSIAGLIEEGSAAQAGRMVLSLSTFLRTTLSLDPLHDVPLADELALQQDYLAIERERYCDRMDFTIDAPAEALQALVPSLLLQPLIENAIKHGVGPSLAHTRIRISARRRNERLWLAVENDLDANAPRRTEAAGFGIGLRNVAERIRVRFGEAGALRVDTGSGTHFRAEIELPWKAA